MIDRLTLRPMLAALMLMVLGATAAAEDEEALQKELAGVREQQRDVALALERCGQNVADVQVALVAAARGGRIDEVRKLAEELRVAATETGRFVERQARLADEARAIMKALHRPVEGGAEEGAESEEIAALRHEVDAIDTARDATRRARNDRATKLLEHAKRARERMIEGKRDAESRRIIDSAPDAAAMAEVLDYAAKLWASYGSRNRTKKVADLAEVYRRRAADEARDRDRGGRGRDHSRRIEALEDEVKELRASYERLRRRADRGR